MQTMANCMISDVAHVIKNKNNFLLFILRVLNLFNQDLATVTQLSFWAEGVAGSFEVDLQAIGAANS